MAAPDYAVSPAKQEPAAASSRPSSAATEGPSCSDSENSWRTDPGFDPIWPGFFEAAVYARRMVRRRAGPEDTAHSGTKARCGRRGFRRQIEERVAGKLGRFGPIVVPAPQMAIQGRSTA
jgi:hypothetical protein